MNAVKRIKAILAEERFKGWPLVGTYEKGAKIPFFGETIKYRLQVGDKVEDYTSIIRTFGWVVALGVTTNREAIMQVQWKPGVNQGSLEFPPGGIGRVIGLSMDKILEKSKEVYTRETGYGDGTWTYLGHVLIETGKYRGATPDDHGLLAHLYLVEGLVKLTDARKPNANEIISDPILVPLEELEEVDDSGLLLETSAVACLYRALRALRKKGLLAA